MTTQRPFPFLLALVLFPIAFPLYIVLGVILTILGGDGVEQGTPPPGRWDREEEK